MNHLDGPEHSAIGTGDAGASAIVFQDASLIVACGRAIVTDLEFGVKSGEARVLLGRSGSGKTTTLKLINRLIELTSGSVLVDGKSTADWDPIQLRRHIGYVIQETGLFPHFTIERN